METVYMVTTHQAKARKLYRLISKQLKAHDPALYELFKEEAQMQIELDNMNPLAEIIDVGLDTAHLKSDRLKRIEKQKRKERAALNIRIKSRK